MKQFKKITELKNIRGKRILVRVDFNVSIKKGKILDDFRIKKALPTIEYLKKKGAKIILISHLGDKGESLSLVSKKLKTYIAHIFVREVVGEKVLAQCSKMKNGEVLLLENLREHAGETKNDLTFSRALASLADIYVNDAFPVCHRAHASVVGVAKLLPSYAGFQLLREITELSRVMHAPKQPFLFLLGGAKFETKIPLIKKFLKKADFVFVGGALANNFFKETGYEVGRSLVDTKLFGLKKLTRADNLFLPVDVIVKTGRTHRVKLPEEVTKQDTIVDIGPMSVTLIELFIARAKMVLWNGPMGNYEEGFGVATEDILSMLAQSRARTIVGGGDTVALVEKLKIENRLSFVSTGGGATIDFLSDGSLPGIDALCR
ncbi:MAG: phosphoglycerate kinase [Candidatus Pacebacteria bacterium]|jgi:phosphoglycerate kinase|nr:phosphoglycerate kinase [Candidatus Paceibacterota bacterium]